MFMLDTNICIYIKKQNPPQVFAKLQSLYSHQVCMSAITFAELMYGALKSQRVGHNLTVLQNLRQIILVKPFNEQAAETYGHVRSDLERKGLIIGSNDLLIAAHALSQGMTLVTNNEKEFRRINGLKIVNWVDNASV
ncbi:MAG: type II toxin-antitoxin system VapC family toxin [Pseudomonadota bacterium]|nr:type II toxin-antitoxin system VapC family toxin [Pseudomonadota bacterium]